MTELNSLLFNLLEESCANFINDMKAIEHQMLYFKEGMFVTHDSLSSIIVYTTNRFKAYIPKRYDGWDVQFIEWNDDVGIPLDIDIVISMED